MVFLIGRNWDGKEQVLFHKDGKDFLLKFDAYE